MKKLLFFAAAALGMFAASCQKEPVNVVNDGKAVVTLSVEVPGAPQTRAIAQAENADIVYFEVWNSDWSKKLPVYMEDGTTLYESTAVSGRKANVELTLVADQTYNFIFWAQDKDCGAYSWETLKNVNVDYSVMEPYGNHDEYDAYYAVKTIKVNGAINETVVLYRPFAQLNFGASKMATSFGPVEVGKTKVTVTGLATSFNTLDGVGENETGAVTFEAEGIATEDEMLVTENGEYTWIAMDYMLMLKDSDLVSVEATFDLGMDVPVHHAIANVPLKKNYRTNIIGDLFAADAKLQIVIDQSFLKDDEGISVGIPEEIKEVDGVYTVEKPGHILWLSEKSNNGEIDFSGKTISFAADIDMMGQGFLPINLWSTKSVTILGNGYTVSDYAVRGDSWKVGAEGAKENAGLFGRVKGSIYDLNVKDVIVEGNYSAGALVGFIYGNVKGCSAENVEINSIPYASIQKGTFIYDDGNNVGGLIGYVGENGYEVSDNTVTNAYLVGYRCIGGVIGTAQKNAVVNGNTVNNIELVVDQTYTPYVDEPKEPYVGQIVGRMISTDDLSDNTVNEAVVTNTQTVATLDELQVAVDAAAASTWIKIVADIEGNVIITQKEGVDLIIDGSANSYDGTFFIHGQARSNGAETLEFRNINFKHAGSELNFIESNSTGSVERYAHNVTVDGCTFAGDGKDGKVVGLKIRQGFDITVKNSTVAGMHSLMQLYGTAGVTVDNVTIEKSGRGIALGTSTDINISNVDFAVDSYGIRADGVTAALDLNNASIQANLPVVVRKLKAGNEYSIALSGKNAFTRGAAQNYDIVFTNGDDEEAFVVPEGKYSITGAEAFSVYPVDIQEIAVANAEELQDAIDNTRADIITLTNKVEKVGLSFEVSRDVIFNMNNCELNAGSTSSSTYYALEVQGENNVVINDANFTRAGVVAEKGADVVFNSGVITHNPERTGRYMFVANHEGTTITVNDGTFINNTSSNKYFWADSNAIIYVKGGTYKGVASKTKIYTSNGGKVIITGGTFNFDPTTWVAEGYQAVKSGSNWTVQPK
ncbi:MAG: DUF6562 domain-containing protein [Bacteroidales bacterium]|nr:DUF6562 domain-containing protein [Bacteroidales bacterium]